MKRKWIVMDTVNQRFFNGLRDVDTGLLKQCDCHESAQDFETIEKAKEWMLEYLGDARHLCVVMSKE